MYRSINAPVHVNNVVGGLNAIYKRYLKEQMEPIGKLSISNTSSIGILPSASKCLSVKLSDQYILNSQY